VKAVAVSEAGARPLLPNPLTVATEDYPLSRRLYLYTPANPENAYTRKFVDFALSKNGQNVVGQNGFVEQNVRAESTPAPAADTPAGYSRMTQGADRLSLDFRFRTGSSDLDNKARVDINRVATFMVDLKNDRKSVMLFGFADNRGSPQLNTALSASRAQAVAAQLQTAGIKPEVVTGFGSEMPVASNDTEDGREKNRRVEIWVKPIR
jgi:phosphate transport system substrate-binding protein